MLIDTEIKLKALNFYYPDGGYVIRNGVVEWIDNSINNVDEKKIQAKIQELQADYDAKQYQRDRLAEYPSIEECIHAILDDDLEALQAKRSAVKAKYPKPE